MLLTDKTRNKSYWQFVLSATQCVLFITIVKILLARKKKKLIFFSFFFHSKQFNINFVSRSLCLTATKWEMKVSDNSIRVLREGIDSLCWMLRGAFVLQRSSNALKTLNRLEIRWARSFFHSKQNNIDFLPRFWSLTATKWEIKVSDDLVWVLRESFS